MDEESTAQTSPVEELSRRECWDLIRGEAYGRLAVAAADGVDVFPVNVVVDHATVVFRTAGGAKLDAMRRDARVAFEVDGRDGDLVWSVVVRGTAVVVTAGHEGVVATELGVTPWQEGPKPIFVRIVPTSVTGRRFSRVAARAWAVEPEPQPQPSPVDS